MTRKYQSRFLTYVLIILIFLTVIQVGTLWDVKSYGIPTSFLRFFSISDKFSEPISREEYLLPSKIIVSEGPKQSRWIIGKNTNRDIYEKIWDETKKYLKEILTSKALKTEALDENENNWEKIVGKKSFVIEFSSNLDSEMISWFLGKEFRAVDFKDIYKIAIVPWDDFLESKKNSIFILSSNDEVYKYTISINPDFDQAKYEAIIDGLLVDQSQLTYMPFGELKVTKPIKKDAMIMVDKKDKLNSISYDVPELFKSGNQDNMAGAIIGIQDGGYDTSSRDKHNNFIFKDEYNIYKVYKDEGVFEYQYLSSDTNTEFGSITQALDKVIEFIDIRNRTLIDDKGMSVYISGAKYIQKLNCYEFYFNYFYNDYPLYYIHKERDDMINKYDGVMNNAIIIRANSNKVLDCLWGLKDIKLLKDKGSEYNLSYDKLQNKLDFISGTFIDDISIGYEINNEVNVKNAEPVWLISYDNGTVKSKGIQKR